MITYRSEIFALDHDELMVQLNEREYSNSTAYEVINIIVDPDHSKRFLVFFRLKDKK